MYVPTDSPCVLQDCPLWGHCPKQTLNGQKWLKITRMLRSFFGCLGSLADAQLQPLAIFQPNPMFIHYNWVNWITNWDFLWKLAQNFEFLSIFVIFSYFSSFSPPIRGPSNLWGHQGGHLWCSGASPNHTPTTISQPAQSETTSMIGSTPISQYDFNYLKLAKVIILQWF